MAGSSAGHSAGKTVLLEKNRSSPVYWKRRTDSLYASPFRPDDLKQNHTEKQAAEMKIRKTTEADFDRIMQIYARARDFMEKTGNPNQWGPTNWPPEALIRQDIKEGNSYVCVNDAGHVTGTFYYIRGKDIEPTYRVISDGAWMDSSEYGVVHRLASDGSEKGTGAFCLEWAFTQCRHLRIDTHTENRVMQNLLNKLGFTRCGIIHVVEDNYPRYAYEKTEQVARPAAPPR